VTVDPSLFYTGLVADLYSTLRSVDPDPEPYARFIAESGEPALELGCGDGDPLLELRRRGLDVEGLDASSDMLTRCRARAEEAGLKVVLHESQIETMDLSRRYQSIFLAGPTFNLLPDDDHAALGLGRIAAHLMPDGVALVPLFIPEAVSIDAPVQPKAYQDADGSIMQVTTISVERNEAARQQRSLLRYERIRPTGHVVLEREWVLHWHTQESFGALAADEGLRPVAVLGPRGGPAKATDQQFVFRLTRA
jgi:SAM-dependent methyltransferase